MLNPYAILDVEPGISLNALKKAFRRKSKQWHPDLNSAPNAAEKFREILWAYELIEPLCTKIKDFTKSRKTKSISLKQSLQKKKKSFIRYFADEFSITKSVQESCLDCHGQGFIKSVQGFSAKKNTCSTCSGRGYRKK